jgi:hypothetical protein
MGGHFLSTEKFDAGLSLDHPTGVFGGAVAEFVDNVELLGEVFHPLDCAAALHQIGRN